MAECPTSFVENGRRKSGRTNIVPLELQPQSKKRQTRAAVQKVAEDRVKQHRPSYTFPSSKPNSEQMGKSMPAGKFMRPKSPSLSSKGPANRDDPTTTKHAKASFGSPHTRTYYGRDYAKHYKQTAKSGPFVHRRTLSSNSNAAYSQTPPTNGYGYSADDGHADEKTEQLLTAFNPKSKLQRITFRVKLPKPAIQSPGNLPAPKKYSSFEEFLEKDEKHFLDSANIYDYYILFLFFRAKEKNILFTVKKEPEDED